MRYYIRNNYSLRGMVEINCLVLRHLTFSKDHWMFPINFILTVCMFTCFLAKIVSFLIYRKVFLVSTVYHKKSTVPYTAIKLLIIYRDADSISTLAGVLFFTFWKIEQVSANFIAVLINNRKMQWFIDTGATNTFIRKKDCDQLKNILVLGNILIHWLMSMVTNTIHKANYYSTRILYDSEPMHWSHSRNRLYNSKPPRVWHSEIRLNMSPTNPIWSWARILKYYAFLLYH
jgi:hypothetical protein